MRRIFDILLCSIAMHFPITVRVLLPGFSLSIDGADYEASLAERAALSAGHKIRKLYPLQRGKIPLPKGCPKYDTKLHLVVSFRGVKNTPFLPLLPGPLWLGVVPPVRVPFIVQIVLFKDYSYSIKPWGKKEFLKKHKYKNMDMNDTMNAIPWHLGTKVTQNNLTGR